MVEWTASGVYDFATADHRGTCVLKSNKLDTFRVRQHRLVSDDLLRLCKTKRMEFVGRASEKKKWNVHARKLTLVQSCLFEVEWQFAPGAVVYDCTPEALKSKNGMETYRMLREVYGGDKFFQKYVGGLKVDILDCDLEHHKGYVSVYPSLPRRAYDPEGQTRYHADPFFFINVELWTGGDCSGYKAPGVKWVFTYKVSPAAGTIEYITTKDANGRPTARASYIPYLKSGAEYTSKRQVVTYKERTKAKAEKLGIDLED